MAVLERTCHVAARTHQWCGPNGGLLEGSLDVTSVGEEPDDRCNYDFDEDRCTVASVCAMVTYR